MWLPFVMETYKIEKPDITCIVRTAGKGDCYICKSLDQYRVKCHYISDFSISDYVCDYPDRHNLPKAVLREHKHET